MQMTATCRKTGPALALTETDVRSAVASACGVICAMAADLRARPRLLPLPYVTMTAIRVAGRVRWSVAASCDPRPNLPGALRIASSRAETARLMRLSPAARAAVIRGIVRAWPEAALQDEIALSGV